MTEMPIEHAAHAAAHAAPAAHPADPVKPTIGRHAWVPKWFVTILHTAHAGVAHLAPVIMSPEVDQLIEAALRAEGLGVEASVFHGAIDLIEGAARRQAQPSGSGPQPAFLPAPADGSEAM